MYRGKPSFRNETTSENVKGLLLIRVVSIEDIKCTLEIVSGFSARGRYIALRPIPDKPVCKTYSVRPLALHPTSEFAQHPPGI
jgi:hypothetical protein